MRRRSLITGAAALAAMAALPKQADALSPATLEALLLHSFGDPALVNFKTSQFTKTKAAFNRVRNGTGRGTIVCIGDSTTWGEGGGTGGTNNRTGAKERCWPSILANALTALGVSANFENIFASGANSGVTLISDFQNSYKVGVNAASAWGFSASTTAGGCLFTNTTDTNIFSYTPEMNVDTFVLYDITNGGAGNILNYNVDGALNTPLSQAAANSFRSTSIAAGSAASHTLNLSRGALNAFVMGFRSYNSAVSQIDIFNLGRGSSTSVDWVLATNPWSSLNAATTLCASADLVIIDLTINDALNAIAQATYQTNLQTIINAAKAGGADILFLTGNPVSTASITTATQLAYVGYAQKVAVNDNNLPFINQITRYGSYTQMVARNFMYNNLHPDTAGYADLGNWLGGVLAKAAA